MIEVLIDNTRWFVPVVLNYSGVSTFNSKMFGEKWTHTSYNNDAGRHPFNILTEEIYEK